MTNTSPQHAQILIVAREILDNMVGWRPPVNLLNVSLDVKGRVLLLSDCTLNTLLEGATAQWNAQADSMNQWPELDIEEKAAQFAYTIDAHIFPQEANQANAVFSPELSLRSQVLEEAACLFEVSSTKMISEQEARARIRMAKFKRDSSCNHQTYSNTILQVRSSAGDGPWWDVNAEQHANAASSPEYETRTVTISGKPSTPNNVEPGREARMLSDILATDSMDHGGSVVGASGLALSPESDEADDVANATSVLRAAGWSVGVHNDYRLNGEAHTFWLWTHPSGRYIKGEGKLDSTALAQCIAQLPSFEHFE